MNVGNVTFGRIESFDPVTGIRWVYIDEDNFLSMDAAEAAKAQEKALDDLRKQAETLKAAQICDDDFCDYCRPPHSVIDQIADLENACMTLANLCEYLIVLTGKKANKQEREAMLTQIDNIRTTLGNL